MRSGVCYSNLLRGVSYVACIHMHRKESMAITMEYFIIFELIIISIAGSGNKLKLVTFLFTVSIVQK